MTGHYTFTDLPAGNFQVGITGYETDDYSFETTSQNVSLALGGDGDGSLQGPVLLRTSGHQRPRERRRHADYPGVTVTISGDELEEDSDARRPTRPGQYGFSGLAEGDYTVAVSEYDDELLQTSTPPRLTWTVRTTMSCRSSNFMRNARSGRRA